jgi:hypothetical protein
VAKAESQSKEAAPPPQQAASKNLETQAKFAGLTEAQRKKREEEELRRLRESMPGNDGMA